MSSPFEGYEVETRNRPSAEAYRFDLDHVLSGIVAVETRVPPDAYTARGLGTERLGNGTLIGDNGLVLTIGYLLTEAEEVTLTLNDDRRVPAHVLGVDMATGFGLVQALEPLDIPSLRLGDSRTLEAESPVILAGAGGRAHSAAGKVLARGPFAGYWEYYLENAILTEPAHPHWSGAALIGASGELMGVGSLSLQRRSSRGRVVPINMFVPSELLPPILDDLTRGKAADPPRPWLGVFAREIGSHVVVADVSAGGPASRAELRSGDVVLAVGGKTISDLADFYTQIWAQGPAGATIPMQIQRERDVFSLEVRSADRASRLKKRRLN